MKDSSEQDKFLNLVIKYHDDNLTEDESHRLKHYLDSSPDYIKQFNDFGLMTTQLIHEFEQPTEIKNHIQIIKEEKNVLSKILTIAALVAISLFSLSTILQNQPGKNIELTKTYSAKISYMSQDLTWDMGEDLIVDNKNTEDGWFNLSKGKAILVFGSGAEVEIEGPALFAVVSPMEAYLEYGQASVYAPESARNFTIKVPTMDIVDLGTKFSIDIDPTDGGSKVNVTEGLVDLHLKVNDQKESLYAGAEAQVDSKGKMVSLNSPRNVPVLFSHWDFNQATDKGTEEDFLGTLLGSKDNLLTLGKHQQAFDFSLGQCIDLKPSISDLPRDNFTVATWVKNPTNMIFSMTDGTKNKRVQFERYKNRLLYGWQNGKFFDSVNAFVEWKEDQWHHVAFSIHEGRVSLFMDGKKVVDHEHQGRLNSKVICPKDLGHVKHAYIGRLFKGSPSKNFPDSIQKLNGQIDDFQIYHATLNEKEIQYLYANPGRTLELSI